MRCGVDDAGKNATTSQIFARKNCTISEPNAPFCDKSSETCALTSGVLCGARAGNVRALCKRGSPTSQQVCTNSNFKQIKFEKNNLIFLDANFARAQREPRARTLRKQTHHRLNQDLRLLRAVSATMAADFLVRCGAKKTEKSQTFREFLRGEIARSRRRTRHFASPKAASTQANAAVI